MQSNQGQFKKGQTAWNKGKKGVYTLSEETRRKMSESRKGKGLGKDNPMFGKHHSEETRRKMSEDRKGENIPCMEHILQKNLGER